MAMYLIKFTQTPETWAKMLANPEDRRKTLAPLFEAAGGRLHGLWYAFGDADGYLLGEFPDDVVAAGRLAKVAASGAFASLSTTKLLTVEETLTALRGGSETSYSAPGAGS